MALPGYWLCASQMCLARGAPSLAPCAACARVSQPAARHPLRAEGGRRALESPVRAGCFGHYLVATLHGDVALMVTTHDGVAARLVA